MRLAFLPPYCGVFDGGDGAVAANVVCAGYRLEVGVVESGGELVRADEPAHLLGVVKVACWELHFVETEFFEDDGVLDEGKKLFAQGIGLGGGRGLGIGLLEARGVDGAGGEKYEGDEGEEDVLHAGSCEGVRE